MSNAHIADTINNYSETHIVKYVHRKYSNVGKQTSINETVFEDSEFNVW